MAGHIALLLLSLVWSTRFVSGLPLTLSPRRSVFIGKVPAGGGASIPSDRRQGCTCTDNIVPQLRRNRFDSAKASTGNPTFGVGTGWPANFLGRRETSGTMPGLLAGGPRLNNPAVAAWPIQTHLVICLH
ncbi:hypothetical protein B0H19DRAFT_1072812 [Mycena capillaripes]|nr:hypothetical protein B0H19DRAFT_1072812 [Mycena capillaripes]